ncbi:MAG TPA: LuxR C-terminal-related transcriptional regulator [Gemmatimonas sp.]|nr:LuxR C-terminal-related transcriptional regulator [Gemmatimonas sp.]
MLRIYLAPHDPGTRNALRRALRDHPDIRLVRSEAEADVVVHDADPRASHVSRVAKDMRLTDRERQVLQRLASGHGNAEIAAELMVSTSTVKFHLAAIFAKLGVHTRTEAVATGVRQGLVML